MYDEVARHAWAQRSAAGDSLFDVNVAALSLDPVLLREAEAIYDAATKPANTASIGKAGGKAKSAGTQCWKCSGWGHVASECLYGDSSKGASKGKGKTIQCYKCGGIGHMAKDCRKAGVKRNADGSEKRY